MQGIIVKALSGFYYVKSEEKIYECKAKGAFRNEGISPLIGDVVAFDTTDETHGIITEIMPRKNALVRPPVANIDRVIIVSSFCTPAPNNLIIDTLTVICEHNGIEPILVFNKSDLGDFTEWIELYKSVGYKVFVTSTETGDGISELKNEMLDGITVLTGNSGVGKSSILNSLFPKLNLAVGEISQKLGRGRHTTRHSQLYRLSSGGFVADTPGFSSLEIDKTDFSFKENLENCFPEFNEFLGSCRFTGCSHTGEKGCAVCEAVKKGAIPVFRHESYISLYNELKDLKVWQTKK